MRRPTFYGNPTVSESQIVTAFRTAVEPWMPWPLRHTRITEEEVWQVLAYASVHRTSLAAACAELAEAPSGNRLREVLMAALPAARTLERRLNAALRQQLPKALRKGKRAYRMALDCTLIPYHGHTELDDPDVLRAQAKAGTHHFHGYATVSILHRTQRYVLAVHRVCPGQNMLQIVRWLLDYVQGLPLRIRRVYLDKEFFSIAVFRSLRARHLPFVMALPMRPRLRRLAHGRRSHFTTYVIMSRAGRPYRVPIALVKRNRRWPTQHKVVRWFAFAVSGLPPRTAAYAVFQLYRQRFGIETSYRQMNQVRARTSSRSASWRFLLVGLALLLVNLYVALRQGWATRCGSPTHPAAHALTLGRLARVFAQALQNAYGLQPLAQFHPPPLLS